METPKIGKHTAQLLARFDGGKWPLSDKELNELINGLQIIFDFCSESKLSPMTVYYGMQIEALERIRENRATVF